MIVATAGHVDHGKTSLVQALTGIDADRLPEEKRRGMTIDLGFAYKPLGDGIVLGFVDVPGHERFVHNMLAGVAGIDLGLLVVAADDGPMPQSREHLAILDLLGVPQGVVALTKIDRVAPERVEAVRGEIAALLSGSPLAAAPVFAVSSATGEGVADLARHLERLARRKPAPAITGRFRMAIDRAFLLRGAGLVVTGTVFAGSVKTGDRLLLSPAGEEVRVRGIHAQNQPAHAGRQGQRCALNISGAAIDKDRVHRGDWLIAPELHEPTRRIDVRLRALPGEGGLRDRQPVHLHLAAADVTGRLALLEPRRLAEGEAGLAQVLLDREIGTLAGDRFVLRDQSAQRTIAGGRVLDPAPPARGRRTPQRLALLAAPEASDPGGALAAAIEAAPFGIDLAGFARAHNLAPAQVPLLLRRLAAIRVGPDDRSVAIARERWAALCQATENAVAAWHAEAPTSPGMEEDRIRRALSGRPPGGIVAAAIAALVTERRLVRQGGLLRLQGHRTTLAPEDADHWTRIETLLRQHGLRPPRVGEVAEHLGMPASAAENLMRRLAAKGLLVRVATNRFFLPETIAALTGIAADVAAACGGSFTAADFNGRTGQGRTVAIELLEHFDATGITRRIGDTRRIAGSDPRDPHPAP